MLLSQQKLAKLMGGKIKHPERMIKVRKSMSRIKRVLSERHKFAADEAKKEFEARKEQGYYVWPPQSAGEGQIIAEQLQSELNSTQQEIKQ